MANKNFLTQRRAHLSVVCVLLCMLPFFVMQCTPPNMRAHPGYTFQYRKDPSLPQPRKRIVDDALSYMGTPYRYGGSTPRGFDCSGLTMYVYKRIGVSLPRSAVSQYRSGRRIAFANSRPGDLVFFAIDGRRVSHVGLYIGEGAFIHAPSTGKGVRIDEISSPYWRARFVCIERFIK